MAILFILCDLPVNHPPLILASTSPYRRALLARLHLDFSITAPQVDEGPLANEKAVDTALRLAQKKAEAVAKKEREALIIGSDQVASFNDQLLGKPGNHARALAQLKMMRGQTIHFHTAVCLLNTRTQEIKIADVPTTVRMRNLADDELDRYLHLEQPYDCAGSANVEGLGIALMESVNSTDPTALIGLPLITLAQWLRENNCPIF